MRSYAAATAAANVPINPKHPLPFFSVHHNNGVAIGL